MPAGIEDIPNEVVLEHLLPALSLDNITALSRVNKHFHSLATDETLWLNLTRRDFAFSPTLLAPPPPPFYQRLYVGMYRPQTYVWGSSNNSRLGNASDPRYPLSVRSRRQYIDTPAPLEITDGGLTWSQNLQDDMVDACQSISGTESAKAKAKAKENDKKRVAVVEMVAGGWSFTVRDQEGAVYVWGQLDGGRFGFGARGWENKHCQIPEPTVLPLPCQAESISSGRTHLLILDRDNLIWELRSWGRAYHHTAASLTSPTNKGASARPHHIVQISAGWSHSACLTSAGAIYLWFPFSDDYKDSLAPDDQLHGPLRPASSRSDDAESEGSGRELKWGQVGGAVVRSLDPLPERPGLQLSNEPGTDRSARERVKAKEAEWAGVESLADTKSREDANRVVKIASGQDFIVALKANGEVWACAVRDGDVGVWIYLPWFSGPAIKHITAQFEWLTSYPAPSASSSASGSGKINHARLNNLHSQTDGTTIDPLPLPSLDDKSVIQIASGDHHHAALTSQGELWTWGEGSNGQLGLGDGVHNVETPRRVAFPGDTDTDTDAAKEHGRKAFVFGITAGGWHTGALVLGDARRERAQQRERTRKEEAFNSREEEENVDRGGIRSLPEAHNGPGIGNHPLGAPFFRVGFAGRGGQMGGSAGSQQSMFRGMRWTRRGGGEGADGFTQGGGGDKGL